MAKNKVKVVNKLPQWITQNDNAMDRAANRMVIDVERIAKKMVPISATKQSGNRRGGGHLKASGYHVKIKNLMWQVIFNKEYAGYQEFGQRKDGSRVVRKYSTPGKKKHYLRDAGITISMRAIDYIKQETARTKFNF